MLGQSLLKWSLKADTKFENGVSDFREALIERLQVTLGFAPKKERTLIERMIKWLGEGALRKGQ
jgi:hypothetical protein